MTQLHNTKSYICATAIDSKIKNPIDKTDEIIKNTVVTTNKILFILTLLSLTASCPLLIAFLNFIFLTKNITNAMPKMIGKPIHINKNIK